MTPEDPVLRPPGTQTATERSPRARVLGFWLALGVLLALVSAVVLYLPRASAPEPKAPESAQPIQSDAPTASAAPANTPTARAEAEETLREYLKVYARLELDRAAVWGAAEMREAAGAAKRGDRFFGQNDFVEARQAYGHGLELLHRLEASRSDRLAAALSAGQEALANDQAGSAVEQFELALAMAPDNAVATTGLARARVRDQVLAQMQRGGAAEQEGDLESARAAYTQATQLDGEYAPAASALQRVSRAISDGQFRVLLGEAIRALDSGRYAESNQALEAAARLKPDDASLQDLRRRLAAARKRSALADLRRRADVRTAAEDWAGAAELYRKALRLAPDAAFAKAGAKRAGERIELHRQLDHYLADPTRLYSKAPLANAEQLLASAGKAPAEEPGLAAKIGRLQGLVAAARKPLPVNLRSDGNTDVVIYHVGHRGRFLHQQLTLTPGTYTAMGTRSGFRDVRKVFEVRPDAPAPTVVVQCEEEI